MKKTALRTLPVTRIFSSRSALPLDFPLRLLIAELIDLTAFARPNASLYNGLEPEKLVPRQYHDRGHFRL